MSGVVVDGYLEGATVFLDLNGNHLLDGDEVSVTTDDKGAFELVVHVSEAQLASSFLHAIVPTTAKDVDDLGKTLAQAGKGGFTLLAPVLASTVGDGGVVSQVVSPLSALVANEMLSAGTTLEQAKANVQQKLGLAGKDLMQDFVQTRDVVLSNIARTTAVGLGKLPVVGVAVDAGVAVDGQQVLSVISSVQADLPKLVDALDLHDATKAVDTDALKQAWSAAQTEVEEHGHELENLVDAAVSAVLPPDHHGDVQVSPDAGVVITLPGQHDPIVAITPDAGVSVDLPPVHVGDGTVHIDNPIDVLSDAGLLPQTPRLYDAGLTVGPVTVDQNGVTVKAPSLPDVLHDTLQALTPDAGHGSDRRDAGAPLLRL